MKSCPNDGWAIINSTSQATCLPGLHVCWWHARRLSFQIQNRNGQLLEYWGDKILSKWVLSILQYTTQSSTPCGFGRHQQPCSFLCLDLPCPWSFRGWMWPVLHRNRNDQPSCNIEEIKYCHNDGWGFCIALHRSSTALYINRNDQQSGHATCLPFQIQNRNGQSPEY